MIDWKQSWSHYRKKWLVNQSKENVQNEKKIKTEFWKTQSLEGCTGTQMQTWKKKTKKREITKKKDELN